MSKARVLFGVGVLVAATSLSRAQAPPPGPLPPVPPVPTGNPITEAKRALGKILFWDEQLSADSTVACGTCHSNGKSGTDGRIGINPGFDGNFATTADNVNGSPGVVHADVNGNPVLDALFGMSVQVTRRSAPAAVVSAFSTELFWDGRAKETFTDPESGQVSLATRAALESQAVGPVISSVEMGRDGRTWASVTAKLAASEPLGNVTKVPADLVPIVGAHPTYGDLFQAAFGDRTITAERIAYAIATYERTLVPNQTPWDLFVGGNPAAMTQGQINGWNFFRGSPCSVCHRPPTFSDNVYHNIGVRPPGEDGGHQEVTLAFGDRGKFKTPTLRGVGLKVTYMHTGVFNNLPDVIAHYRPGNPNISLDNIDPILPVAVPPQVGPQLVDFLANALTDPRVRDQQFPFDQPTLHANALPQLTFDGDKTTLRWPALAGVTSYVMYRGDLADLVDANLDGLPDVGYGVCMNGVDPNVADSMFVDTDVPFPSHGFFYVKGVRDGAVERGLGVTSAVKAREPQVECP